MHDAVDPEIAQPRARGHLALGVGLVAGLVVLGPAVWQRGFLLIGDMVFVPRLAWSPWLFGRDGSAPRQVPSDLFVAVASRVLPGDLVQDLVVAIVVTLAAWGAGRLASELVRGRVPVVTAALAYAWTPFLYERLMLGQWALLIGWAVLPWVVATAARSGVQAALWVAAGSVGGPSAWLLVSLTALVVCLFGYGRGVARRTLVLVVAVAICSLPWSVPWVLGGHGPADPAAAGAFAARADTALGTLGSLALGGGVWNSRAAPPARDSAVVAVLSLALLAAVVSGLVVTGRRRIRPVWWLGLAVVAAVGLGLAMLGAVSVTRGALEGALRWSAAAGLLRDGQKFVAAWTLLAAVGLAACAQAITAHGRDLARRTAAVLVMVLPLVVLPALAFGAGGRLRPVEYPAGWEAAADAVSQEPGTVLVLPWQPYRAFDWNANRPSLDPARRWLPGAVLASDTLVVGDTTIGGDDPNAALLQPYQDDPAELVTQARALGASWVLVEHLTPGDAPNVAGRLVVSTPALDLYAVTPTGAASGPAVGIWPVVAAWLVVAGYVAGSTCWLVLRRAQRP